MNFEDLIKKLDKEVVSKVAEAHAKLEEIKICTDMAEVLNEFTEKVFEDRWRYLISTNLDKEVCIFVCELMKRLSKKGEK